MKPYLPAATTILAAVLIIVVLSLDGIREFREFEEMQQRDLIREWNYDGGWPRPLCMALAAGILLIQSYWIWCHRNPKK